MKSSLRSLLVIFLLSSPTFIYGNNCPPCYITPMNVRDDGSRSANGRPFIKLQIAGSWDDTPGHTNAKLFNAVQGAVNNWNNATDTGDSTGHGTHYEIKFDATTQQADSRTVGIIVARDQRLANYNRNDDRGTPRITGNAGGPYHLNLRPDDVTACTDAALREIIEHEISHVYGLGHRAWNAACPHSLWSITQAPTTNDTACEHVSFRGISPLDVQTINQRQRDNVFRTGNCLFIYPNTAPNGGGEPTPTPTIPIECTDADNDGICHAYSGSSWAPIPAHRGQ